MLEHYLFWSNRDRLYAHKNADAWCGDVRATITNDATVWYAVWSERQDKVLADARQMLDAVIGMVAQAPSIDSRLVDKTRNDIRNEASYRQGRRNVTHLYEVLFPDHILGQDPLGTAAVQAIVPEAIESAFAAARGAIRNVIVFAEGAAVSELLSAAMPVVEVIQPTAAQPIMAPISHDRRQDRFGWRASAVPAVVAGISLPPLLTAYPDRSERAQMALLAFMMETFVGERAEESIVPAFTTSAAVRVYVGARANSTPWVFRDAGRVKDSLESFLHLLRNRLARFREAFEGQLDGGMAAATEDPLVPVRLIQLADREQLDVRDLILAAPDLNRMTLDALAGDIASAQRRAVLYLAPDEPADL